ncbi:protein kinase [Pseudofrankia sp. BMG5.36]|uniref:protein kinase domain-containing protein n=1 Tax=Pseudofrankia sp. BMG5.36 TaxID=1834512 RepID=UPI0008D9D757|nr:protein kinase [Pseudofrankia sp. BMG5.36]OHV60830.1 hypothetical protein BCD48_40405 [Pseudofrankia sp. BMG5.36]
MQDIALPVRLGPTTLMARIGAGGMGIVYYGLLGQTPVAVKVIRAELADAPEFRARFRREIELMRRVGGVCTARVHAADPDWYPPYLATEFLAGPTLADWILRNGPVTGPSLRTLAVGLAEALLAVHRAGVVHRDLKPGNVLLTQAGPKVVDFGIALATDVTVLTRVGTPVGTPGYMSPEQLNGIDVVGPPADVFAWGCTVAYAATGRTPFGAGPTDAVLFRVRHDPPNLAGIPDDLAGLVDETLRKDPAARPDAAELLRRLLALVLGPDWASASPARTGGPAAGDVLADAGAAGDGERGWTPETDADLARGVLLVLDRHWPIRTYLPPPVVAPAPAAGGPARPTPAAPPAAPMAPAAPPGPVPASRPAPGPGQAPGPGLAPGLAPWPARQWPPPVGPPVGPLPVLGRPAAPLSAAGPVPTGAPPQTGAPPLPQPPVRTGMPLPPGARGPLGPPPTSGPPSSPLAPAQRGPGGHGPGGRGPSSPPSGPHRLPTGVPASGGPRASGGVWRRPRHGLVGAGFVAVVAVVVVLVLVAVSLVALRLFTHDDDGGTPSSTHTQQGPTAPVSTNPVSPGDGATPQAGPKTADGPGAVSSAGPCRYVATDARGPAAPIPPSVGHLPTGTATMTIQTNGGIITAELDAALAPCAVYALRHLAGEGYYDNSLCPRQTDGPNQAYYILQCGDPTGTGSGAPGFAYDAEHPPSDFRRGVIAVVHGSSGANGAQFVISYANPSQEGREEMADRYTPVGRVVDGFDVLDDLVAPGADGGYDGPPASDARILSLTVEP